LERCENPGFVRYYRLSLSQIDGKQWWIAIKQRLNPRLRHEPQDFRLDIILSNIRAELLEHQFNIQSSGRFGLSIT
jgi:hypothetical protein